MVKENTEKNGIVVYARQNEDPELLIKRFKKKVLNSGILKEVKKYSFYEKPSEKKKRKRIESRMRNERELLKQQKIKSKFLKKFNKDNEK